MANCSICIGDVTTPTFCVPCGHVFCDTCINQWKQQNSICPLCRQNIDKLQRLYLPFLSDNSKPGRHLLQRRRTRMPLNGAVIVFALIVFVPFAIVYCDFGCRLLAPTVLNVTNNSIDVTTNWTIEKLQSSVDIVKLTKLKEDVMNCVSAFFYDELSLCWSLLQVVGKVYGLLLQMATLFTNGLQSAVIELFNVLKDVVVLIIQDLFYCIKSLLAFPIYKIFELGLGIWEVLKSIWEFLKVVVAPLGWFAFYLCKVLLRFFIYVGIVRLLKL